MQDSSISQFDQDQISLEDRELASFVLRIAPEKAIIQLFDQTSSFAHTLSSMAFELALG